MARHGSAKPSTAVRIRSRPHLNILKTLEITFLGTGTSQGVPIIACQCDVCQSSNPKDKRLRTSVLVQTNGKNIVIDSGPDFRYQMLRCGITKLDGLLLTHSHKDHIAGLDDIRAFNYIQKTAIDVYLEKATLEAVKREFYYIFEENKYPGVPEINTNIIENKEFNFENTPITPIRVMHYKMPVLGFRIGDFSYITDANFIAEKEKEKIYGSKVLVLNALRKSNHISHFSLEEALQLAAELKIPKTYLIHVSHQLGLHDEVSAALPSGIMLAYDTLKVTL